MTRHPTNRNILVETMPCGCRLDIVMQSAGRARGQAGTRLVGLPRDIGRGLRWNEVSAFLGRLVQCAEHRAQWSGEDDQEQEGDGP